MLKVSSVLELMKNTPLVRLKGRARSRPTAALWAKLELGMPGQMKDRVALRAIEDAEKDGRLRPGGVVVESSSGTMAEGLARVGAVKGYRVIIVTDPRIDAGMIAKLKSFGAQLEIVDVYHPTGGWQVSRLARLKQMLDQNPGAFWPCQYDTPSNPAAYDPQMAEELMEALGGKLSSLVATVGSGGSLCGSARALKARIPGVQVVAVDSVGSVLFHQPNRKRLQSGHGNSIVPGNIDYEVIDEVHWVGDGEAFNGCHELARKEGIFAGGSSGAAYVAACWVAEQYGPDEHVVVVLPDRGDRYAETIFSEDYLKQNGVAGVEAGEAPVELRYGVDAAERWSRARLPRDGSIPYFSSEVEKTADIARALGLT